MITANPIITIDAARLPKNYTRIDIIIKNTPSNFFGLAFDLNINGGKWELQKYETGPVFKKPSDILALAVKRETPQPHLVFGVSYKGNNLKSGNKPKTMDGKLASFYLKTDNLESFQATFSNNTVSIYENGIKNITGAVWENKIIESKTLNPAFTKSSAIQKSGGNFSIPATVAASPKTIHTSVFQPETNFLQIYLVLGISLLLIIIASGAAALILKGKKFRIHTPCALGAGPCPAGGDHAKRDNIGTWLKKKVN